MRPATFDSPVAENGYRWWYLDATDSSSQRALVIIVFVGSVFSPYYYRARQRANGQAENFCAINIGLYGNQRGKRWAMTERRSHSIVRSADEYRLGPSSIRWKNGQLVYDINERCAPLGQRLRGKVRVTPRVTHDVTYFLDEARRHRWTPWSPQADVEVELEQPEISWKGHGYVDGNDGDESLETAFNSWDWSRSTQNQSSLLQYDVLRADQSRKLISVRIGPDGKAQPVPELEEQYLRNAGWGVARRPRARYPLALVRTLEDTPFYTRNLLREQCPGGEQEVVHESLSLLRFKKPWVRTLLPFRMPREFKAGR